jgi:HlyD family secretion protein
LAVIVGGFFAAREFFARRQAQQSENFQTEPARTGSLTATAGATGIVRSNQSAILIWQTTGIVAEVKVSVGDEVTAGQQLAVLEQTSLPQSVILAQAELVSAEKALSDLLSSTLPQAQAIQAVEDAIDALANLDSNYSLQIAQAEIALANARDALNTAEYRWRVQQKGFRASGDTINASEANLILAEKEVERAEAVFNSVSGRSDDDPSRALALSNLSAARQQRDSVLRQLNWLTGEPTDIDQAILDANVALAQAQLMDTEALLETLGTEPGQANIALLEARLAEAERGLERLKDGPPPDDIAAAEARIAAAKATLDLAYLDAPFDGTITDGEIKVGDQVGPNVVAFRVDDLSRLLVDVEISEVDINRIEVGQPVTLFFDAVLDKEYQGIVQEVGVVGSTLQGAVNFKVTIELVEVDADVKPGMTAGVNIVVNQLSDVLLVPNRAVRIRDGKRVVFVLKGGVAEPIEITLGASSETVSEILDGDLKAADLIVLNPPSEPIFFGGPPGSGP